MSTLLQLHTLQPKPARLVLWNPVLDLSPVFVNPTTAWGKKNFGKTALNEAIRRGFSIVDGSVRVGQVFLEEARLHSGNLGAHLGDLPTLVIHGTKDSYVPIAPSRRSAKMRNVRLLEIPNSEPWVSYCGQRGDGDFRICRLANGGRGVNNSVATTRRSLVRLHPSATVGEPNALGVP